MERERRYELYFPPPPELIMERQPLGGLRVSWWSQEKATKEAQNRRGADQLCVVFV